MSSNDISVTVIVLTYNGKLSAILPTLNSIIYQKGINTRIIISDDCSSLFDKEKIVSFLKEKNYENYLILEHKVNQGTVLNTLDAVNNVRTEYVKIISQGDLLYCDTCLTDMVQFMKQSNYQIAFGKIVGYVPSDSNKIVEFFSPQDITAYVDKDIGTVTSEFIYYLNGPCGACHMYETEVLQKYLNKIANKVRYCEDNILAMYLLDGGEIGYYRKFFVWYEIGSGVSTSNNKNTNRVMRNDQYNFYKCLNEIYDNQITRSALRLYSANRIDNNIARKIMKIIVHPSLIFFRYKVNKNLSLTRKNLGIENADKRMLNKYLAIKE